ncbi:MAG: IS30 family transposase [Megasphaera cerevisiae]|nr:IS30 family transposase [Megasphaera cerevisiae]
MIIMENQFAIQYALQADDSIGICTCIPDPVLVQDIYDRFSLRFSTQNPILASAKVLGIDELGFRTAFYSVNNFFFFLTNGFDFLLPSQSIDDFLEEIHASPRVIRQISHLRIMWEELLSRVNVEFMLPTTSIIRYIETGYMFFTDAEYRMKAEDRKSHIKNIIYTMKKNPHIVMGVLQSSTETAEYYESNLSFYSNFSSAYELKRGTATKTTHRGRPTEYVPSRGQAVYYENRKRSGRKQRITSESPFAIWVAEQVKKANWSLDVCAGYAKKHNLFTEEELVCAKTLYNALNQSRLPLSLFDVPELLSRKKSKPKQAKNVRIFGRSIDERPDIVKLHLEIGHWEIDTIVGNFSQKKSAIYHKRGQSFLYCIKSETRQHISCLF